MAYVLIFLGAAQPMKSHIQIPKGLLKQFSHKIIVTQNGHINKVDAVYALNIKEKSIIEEKINSFGTIENYFSDEIDKQILNKKVENPFCDVTTIIKTQIEKLKRNQVTLRQKEKNALYKFCQYSHLRAPRQINSLNNDNFMRALNIKLTPSEFIDMADKSPFMTNPFSGRLIAIIKNETAVNFVIPFHCIYLIDVRENISDVRRDIIILPFTPKYAIALLPIKDNQKQQLDIINLTSEEKVSVMNDWAFRTELTNKQYLIATEDKELKKYADILDEIDNENHVT